MGFIPFSYWGYGCNDFLPTGSLVFYYNSNDTNSYDKLFTGSGTNTDTGIINLANQGTNLGIVYNSSYNNTYYGINTLSGRIDNNIPLILYDTAQQGTVLVKGYMAPLINASNKYLLRNPSNSNEGIRAFGTVNTTTKGKFTFSRGVTDADGAPTSSMYNTEGVGTIAITKQLGTNYGEMSVSSDNFTTVYTANVAINDFDFIFENLGYFQAAAYWDRKLTTAELISASTAFNCNGQPQGYNATTSSNSSSAVGWYGGTSGTTAYYLEPGQTTLTRRPIAIGETFYDCVCNTGSRLDTGGSSTSTTIIPGPCQPSASTTYPTIEYLLIGGGGGGGANAGGGGGAGGYLSGSLTLTTGSTYPITIGNGGIFATTTSVALNGGDTTAFGLTSFGGGAGGSRGGSLQAAGYNGGCGGGSAVTSALISTGSQGGNGAGATANQAGGGGGTGLSAGNINGEDGKYWLDMIPTYRGGGGGGSTSTNQGAVGSGGQGGGGQSAWGNAFAVAGGVNTGGGGGGGYFAGTQRYGASGGNGIVAIRYNGTPQFNDGTIVQALGMTYHYFTSSFTLNT